MGNHLGEHAVVIGGSLAGLMTARVLADHLDSVTVLERDHIDAGPVLHKSIPQRNHVYGLLPGGQRAMRSLYPDLFTNLEKLGALRCRLGRDFVIYLPSGRAYSFSGTVRKPRDLGSTSTNKAGVSSNIAYGNARWNTQTSHFTLNVQCRGC
jgi:2-polyprenyl-6-methoxyphenol hydroxylase-like FAD-dependent oxidoreductase